MEFVLYQNLRRGVRVHLVLWGRSRPRRVALRRWRAGGDTLIWLAFGPGALTVTVGAGLATDSDL